MQEPERKNRSSMKLLSFRNTAILLLALLAPKAGFAHLTNMTKLSLTLTETGDFELMMELDPGEKILGYDDYYALTQMKAEDRVAPLQSVNQQIENRMHLQFDGVRAPLQVIEWILPNAPQEAFGNPRFPTMSKIRLKGTAPAKAEKLEFFYDTELGLPTPVMIRVDKPGVPLPFSRLVDGPGRVMQTITLVKPVPPLLPENELRAAAHIIHDGKAWFTGYTRWIDFRWQFNLLPVLASAAFSLWLGAEKRWLRPHLLAAGVLAVTLAVVRQLGVPPAPVGNWLHAGLAAAALGAGLAVALGVKRKRPAVLVGAISAVLAGLCASLSAPPEPSAIVGTIELSVLESLGAGCAWLAVAVVTQAVIYELKHREAALLRTAALGGTAIAGVSLYWLYRTVSGGA
jgi:hypothetical protein